MATKISRIDKFWGGITKNEKSTLVGSALVMEELDIFTNENYIQPETVLSAEANYPGSTSLNIGSYDSDDSNNLWAIVNTKLLKITNGNAANPGDFASYATSLTTRTSVNFQVGRWHGLGNPISTAYFYYVGGTNTLYRVGDLKAAGTTESSVGTLDGMSATTTHTPFERVDGELYIGHGQYIAKVDDSGIFTAHAFTLPNNWECVGFAPYRDQLAILAKFKGEIIESPHNQCRVYIWDKTATTGPDDVIIIPSGGAQAIVNHNEILRAFTAQEGKLKIWELTAYPTVTHELSVFNPSNSALSASSIGDFVVCYNSLFVKNGILFFGVMGPIATNKSGLYALGKVSSGDEDKPTALVMAKRYSATASAAAAYSHGPLAAYGHGPNIYCSYMDRASSATAAALRVEEANSPSRSSNALYESLLIDAGSPENAKDWKGFILNARLMPASCAITVDVKTDNASSYDSNSEKALNSTNDYNDTGTTADRYWFREFTSVVGRALQLRLRFTSSSTSTPQLYSIGLLSEAQTLI